MGRRHIEEVVVLGPEVLGDLKHSVLALQVWAKNPIPRRWITTKVRPKHKVCYIRLVAVSHHVNKVPNPVPCPLVPIPRYLQAGVRDSNISEGAECEAVDTTHVLNQPPKTLGFSNSVSRREWLSKLAPRQRSGPSLATQNC